MGELPLDLTKGLALVGVVPLVVNFNMRFRPQDAKDKVNLITKSIREKDLAQALTLEHEEGSLEVACNLLNVRVRAPTDVLNLTSEKCREMDIQIVKSYTTGPTEEELLARLCSS